MILKNITHFNKYSVGILLIFRHKSIKKDSEANKIKIIIKKIKLHISTIMIL